METGNTSDELERPHDLGPHPEFWSATEADTRTDAGLSLNPPPALTVEQLARRARLRRLVAGIVVSLGALTAVAGIVGLVRHQRTSTPPATTTLPDTNSPALAAPPIVPVTPLATTADVTSAPAVGVPSVTPAFDWQAFALEPSPDAAALASWATTTKQLDHAQFVRADRELLHASNKGDVGRREAARFARALLWRANGYPRPARGALVQLAEHAKTAVVRDGARAALSAK